MLKALKGAWTGGGVAVDLTLENGKVRPGDTLTGEIVVSGGKVERRIEGLGLELFVNVWGPSSGDNLPTLHEYTLAERADLLEGFTLAAPAERRIPFTLDVPWVAPLTLEGEGDFTRTPFHVPQPDDHDRAPERVRLRTRLAVDRSRDRFDTDPLEIHALPAHAGVFAALERIGFWFNRVELDEVDYLDSGFEQTFIVNNAPDYPFALVVNFRADATKVDVLLEAQDGDWDFAVEHGQVEGFDFEGALRGTLDRLAGDWRA
jgi:sporulation-control protein